MTNNTFHRLCRAVSVSVRNSRSGRARTKASLKCITTRSGRCKEDRLFSAQKSFVHNPFSTTHLTKTPVEKMQIFSFLIASAIAVSGGAAAETTSRMTKFPVRPNGFSDFCSAYSLDQKGNELQVSGECSSEPNGARKMGAALFTSHININRCLTNVNGNLVPSSMLVPPSP